jgi:uncharacterized DUF497 family protein
MNLKKHSVSFDDAATVLLDENGEHFHVEEYDDRHSTDEDRWVTTASHPVDRRIVIRVAWSEAIDADGPYTRIISARAATARERKVYEAEIETRAQDS